MATVKIESDRTFRDLDLNFTLHPVKLDVNTHKDEFAIINSVKNLILTNYYERLFQPQIGSGLRGLLFEPIDSLVAASIEREVVETINNFEPRARVSSVAAVPSPDENRYNIRLEFFIINDPNPITINFFLERIR